MTVGRITADGALDWLVDEIQGIQLTTGDTRVGFTIAEVNDEDGSMASSVSRAFAFYVTGQGASPWCWGGEYIALQLLVVYQNQVNFQDLVELKNHLEYNAATVAGIGGVETLQSAVLGNDVGDSNIVVQIPIVIKYLPPKIQGE